MALQDLFVDRGLRPGTYRYDGKGALSGHRFHLRVDSEQRGVLLVDASKLLFVNGTALDHVRGVLEGWDEAAVVKYLRKRYRRLDKARAAADHRRVRGQLVEFVEGDLEVVRQVTSPSMSIGADRMASPYRMDLALTYDCQNECGHCYNEHREVQPMPKERWLGLVDRLWEIGIPHVVFTGGEPTLVPHLGELVARSEGNGQVTGLITNGRRLAEGGYLRGLIDAGLDHVQVTVLSHREGVHDRMAGAEGAWAETVAGIKAAVGEDVYLSTNTTIMSENLDDVEATLRFLVGLGVGNVSFNGIIRSGRGKGARAVSYDKLEDLLQRLVAVAEEREVNLVWYTPTPYCELNPLSYGLGIKQCTACSLNMAVEPDGTVLPCQSYYEPLGNVLEDPWPNIWDHDLCRRIRERDYMADECRECDLAQVCGGGCPLSLEAGDYVCLDSHSSM